MRKIIFILLIVIASVACEDREPEPIVVPNWLKPQLSELESSGNCVGCRVQRWTYNEEYFYHLYCDYWSCLDCVMFHYDGTPVEWGVTVDQADFYDKRHRPKLIWECGDEL